MKKQILFCFSIPKDFKLHNKLNELSSSISVWSGKQFSLWQWKTSHTWVQKCQMLYDLLSLPKKKILFFFLLLYSGTQYEPNCNSRLRGAPVQTDSPTWNCQSLEPVWLSPSTCRVWEGGGAGRPGLRFCPWAGAEAGFTGTWPWASNPQWFWLQKLLHDVLSFYSLIIAF